MTEIMEIINQYTFPLVTCVALGIVLYNQMKINREDSQLREQKLFEQLSKNNDQMEKFSDVLKSMDMRLLNIESKVGKKDDK